VRLLLEGVVILSSILVAFFLEGWRDDRELDREVRQEVESVLREIQRNQELVRAEIVTLDRILMANDTLMAVLDDAAGEGSVSVADTLVFLARQWQTTFSPSLGAVEALIASGRLAQIEDAKLRQGLAGLRETIGDALNDELMAQDIAVNQLLPLLRGMYRFPGLGLDFFGTPREGLTPQEGLGDVAVPHRGDVRFPAGVDVRNTLLARTGWYSGARSKFLSMEDHLSELVALLARELE
jgi:hypothetical protein